MLLSDVASIGSLVSGMAVLVSLVYLSFQVRQTERNQRTLLQQGTSARTAEGNWRLAEPHMAAIFAMVANGETRFSDAQLVQLRAMLRATLVGYQDQLLLKKIALIDDMQFETQDRVLKRFLSLPALRSMWILQRDEYAPEFSAYVDAHIKGVPLFAPGDYDAIWDAALAEAHVVGVAPRGGPP